MNGREIPALAVIIMCGFEPKAALFTGQAAP